jgi:hypothetical protein
VELTSLEGLSVGAGGEVSDTNSIVSVPVQGIPVLGATAATSTVTTYSVSVHTSITYAYGTSIPLFGASSGPESNKPTSGEP